MRAIIVQRKKSSFSAKSAEKRYQFDSKIALDEQADVDRAPEFRRIYRAQKNPTPRGGAQIIKTADRNVRAAGNRNYVSNIF